MKTKHFGFFHKGNTTWEAYTVYAKTIERAWELIEENGCDPDNYLSEDYGTAKNEMGKYMYESLIYND